MDRVRERLGRVPDLRFGIILEAFGAHLGAVPPLGRHSETLSDAPVRTLLYKRRLKEFWVSRGEQNSRAVARAQNLWDCEKTQPWLQK